MIALLFATVALGDMPDALPAVVPEATAALAACDAAPLACDRDEAARMAWLLALHTYLDEGVADGALAATVQALDPALFAQLPDVIQASATAPMPWVSPPEVASASSAPEAGVPVVAAAQRGGLKEGFYRDAEELYRNEPGAPFVLSIAASAFGFPAPDRWVDHNRINLAQHPDAPDEVLGFSDGTDVYVNTRGQIRAPHRSSFVKIDLVDQYGVFYLEERQNGSSYPSGSNLGQPTTVGNKPSISRRYTGDGSDPTAEEIATMRESYRRYYVIELSTGDVRPLNKRLFRSIIADDEALVQAFRGERNKYHAMPRYLRLYAERS